jgi:hypothetical protein
LVLLFAFSSCELTTTPEELIESGETIGENVKAELEVIEVFENVNNFGFNSDGLKGAVFSGEKPSLSWSGLTLTLNYNDLVNSSGKIVVVFSQNPMYSVGLVATVTFDDYVRNGMGIAGAIEMTIKDYVLNEAAVFGIKTMGDLVFTKMGSSYNWSCDQTMNWIEGVGTLLDNSDDAFLINGTSTQVIDTMTHVIKFTDVLYSSDCEYIKSGIIEMETNSDGSPITCDFGVGQNDTDVDLCDAYVQVSSGGLTLKIEL